MSTDVYAGHLCLTHIGGGIAHPDLDPSVRWVVHEIKMLDGRPTVKVIAKPIDGNMRNLRCLVLGPRDVVTVCGSDRHRLPPDEPAFLNYSPVSHVAAFHLDGTPIAPNRFLSETVIR